MESKIIACGQGGAARGTTAGGGLRDASWCTAESKEMHVWGASRAAGFARGDGDGMHGCMARVRRACRCAARDAGHARGREALL